MAEKLLDATGLGCPFPELKAAKVLYGMAPGETLELLSSDPASIENVAALCRSAGHELLDSSQINSHIFRFVIKRVEAHEQAITSP